MPLAHNEFSLQCGLLLHLEFIPLLYGLQWSQNTSDYGGNVLGVGMVLHLKAGMLWGDDFTQTITVPVCHPTAHILQPPGQENSAAPYTS